MYFNCLVARPSQGSNNLPLLNFAIDLRKPTISHCSQSILPGLVLIAYLLVTLPWSYHLLFDEESSMESRAVLLVTLFTCCKQISEQHVVVTREIGLGDALFQWHSRGHVQWVLEWPCWIFNYFSFKLSSEDDISSPSWAALQAK
jgi:hypothetical protein